ncbi:hypothetical protein LX36DRAFT_30140 [Colletotrichum falcatum]|nr:hypothetical protein LX36DRAFT_30140 [Colletotrichum falcatum]
MTGHFRTSRAWQRAQRARPTNKISGLRQITDTLNQTGRRLVRTQNTGGHGSESILPGYAVPIAGQRPPLSSRSERYLGRIGAGWGKGGQHWGSPFIPTHADDPAISRAGPYLTIPPPPPRQPGGGRRHASQPGLAAFTIPATGISEQHRSHPLTVTILDTRCRTLAPVASEYTLYRVLGTGHAGGQGLALLRPQRVLGAGGGHIPVLGILRIVHEGVQVKRLETC